MGVFYHITERGALPKILKRGLVPKTVGGFTDPSWGIPKGVYLFNDLDVALNFLSLNEGYLDEPIVLELQLPERYGFQKDEYFRWLGDEGSPSMYNPKSIPARFITRIIDVPEEGELSYFEVGKYEVQ